MRIPGAILRPNEASSGGKTAWIGYLRNGRGRFRRDFQLTGILVGPLIIRPAAITENRESMRRSVTFSAEFTARWPG